MASSRYPVDDNWDAVYAELRKRASRHLRRYSQTTLSTTTLVHEAYVRLATSPDLEINDLDHYLRTASQAMRWVLADSSRAALRAKRGGGSSRVEFRDELSSAPVSEEAHEDDLVLHRALRKLFELDAREAHVLVMRSLGMRIEEVATALGVSRSTVDRDWAHGLAWLYRELTEAEP